jgi:hypothetical protein
VTSPTYFSDDDECALLPDTGRCTDTRDPELPDCESRLDEVSRGWQHGLCEPDGGYSYGVTRDSLRPPMCFGGDHVTATRNDEGAPVGPAASPSSDRAAIEAAAARAGVVWRRDRWARPDDQHGHTLGAARQMFTSKWLAWFPGSERTQLHATELDALHGLPPADHDATRDTAPERVASPRADECTRVDPCLTRRDLDITVAGEVGVVSILFDDHGQVWALHDDAGRMVVAIDHCPWCGLSLGGGL